MKYMIVKNTQCLEPVSWNWIWEFWEYEDVEVVLTDRDNGIMTIDHVWQQEIKEAIKKNHPKVGTLSGWRLFCSTPAW